MSVVGYQWFKFRHWLAYLPKRLTWWVALQIPANVALHVFIRVYAIDGECGPEFDRITRAWTRKYL